ncbi:MAG: hypothetical protein HFE88_08580 [Acutalibacter sp.]|nr:hypothetical protein [Acutalibacter sp.]MCI8921900.1 hypothetical protein [Acutalibacter sp.]
MDLQKLTFFTEGNTFTGSVSKDPAAGLLLRYLVEPDKENEQLKAYAWRKDLCFERAGEKEEQEFPMTQQGLEEADAWLQGLFDAL